MLAFRFLPGLSRSRFHDYRPVSARGALPRNRGVDMFDTFKAKAEAASCQVVRFATRVEALEFILQFMRNEGVADAPGAYAVWADCPFLKGFDRKDLEAKVPGLKFDSDPPGREGRQDRRHADGLGDRQHRDRWPRIPPRWSSGWPPP